MTKFFRVPTKICGDVSEFWAPVAVCPLPNWGVRCAADTVLFVAIWHQKHIRVKLNNGLLTNEIEETDTLKGGGSRFRGLAHMPDRSARVPSSARVPGLDHPWYRQSPFGLFFNLPGAMVAKFEMLRIMK